MAFRDAIIGQSSYFVTLPRDSLTRPDVHTGHRTAMTRGGILHRDVSVGNILIVDDPALQDQSCGFLHDFDYSSMSRDVPHYDISSLSAEAVDDLLVADDTEGSLKERTVSLLLPIVAFFASIDAIRDNRRELFYSWPWTFSAGT